MNESSREIALMPNELLTEIVSARRHEERDL